MKGLFASALLLLAVAALVRADVPECPGVDQIMEDQRCVAYLTNGGAQDDRVMDECQCDEDTMCKQSPSQEGQEFRYQCLSAAAQAGETEYWRFSEHMLLNDNAGATEVEPEVESE